jgi:hypothetical protein
MAFVATEGPTGYRIETAKIATTTKAKATITAVIAGYRNFRIDGRVVDLSSTGLLSVATKGGIVGGSKKASISPLIHLLMSTEVIIRIPRLV